jgi:hypothetical protein
MHVIRFILGASCKPSFVKRKIDWITHKCTKCIEIYLFIYFIYLKNLPVTAGVTIRGHRGSILDSTRDWQYNMYILENTCMQKPSPCWQNHCIFRTWSI